MPEFRLNKIRCKHCNTTAVSTHVHHMCWCKCGKVAADGGLEYLRRAGYPEDYEELSERADGSRIASRDDVITAKHTLPPKE